MIRASRNVGAQVRRYDGRKPLLTLGISAHNLGGHVLLFRRWGGELKREMMRQIRTGEKVPGNFLVSGHEEKWRNEPVPETSYSTRSSERENLVGFLDDLV
jgi:hypothetical protein